MWYVFAINVRRCRDRGHSGWWQLIPSYTLWLTFGDGDAFENDYGPDSKGRDMHVSDELGRIRLFHLLSFSWMSCCFGEMSLGLSSPFLCWTEVAAGICLIRLYMHGSNSYVALLPIDGQSVMVWGFTSVSCDASASIQFSFMLCSRIHCSDWRCIFLSMAMPDVIISFHDFEA